MKKKTIAIIGLGLMGGSLAVKCRKVFPSANIIGVSRSRNALAVAKRKKWIHHGTQDLKQAAFKADLVILCTPVHTFSDYLKQIDRHAKAGTLVTDVGSVKTSTQKLIKKKNWKNIHFISAHPMVGSHEKGIQAVKKDLYDAGYTFVIKTQKASPKALKAVVQFWKKVSPAVQVVSISEHDTLVSEMSHLPHLVAVSLVAGISPNALKASSSGFRDTTRIAMGNPAIWTPIFDGNRREILKSFRTFQRESARLMALIQAGKPEKLEKFLKKIAQKRAQI